MSVFKNIRKIQNMGNLKELKTGSKKQEKWKCAIFLSLTRGVFSYCFIPDMDKEMKIKLISELRGMIESIFTSSFPLSI